MANDAAEVILGVLKTSTATGAAAIRALLARGADSIMEARAFGEEDVQTAETARRALDPEARAVALLLTVEDLGDDPDATRDEIEVQHVALRIIDRARGYGNIRAVRKAIRRWLFTEEAWEECDIAGEGLLELRYGGRSGYVYSPDHNVEVEAITVQAQVVRILYD
jgi:hypothetical protein